MTTKASLLFHLGQPQISGSLAVYPIFGPEPRLGYRSLSQATKYGAFVTEVDEHGSVNDVLVCNASDQPLLLYDGEVIAGARQNRIIDQPTLVPAGTELKVPVSCVERGRWDDRRRADRFVVTDHTADPALRRTKRATANGRGSAGSDVRPEQNEVWHEIEARLEARAVAAPTRALTDLFDANRPALAGIKEPIRAVDGQLGAVVEIGGRTVALDLVSRPGVFADLLPRLADGYALQALEPPHAANPLRRADDGVAEDFLELVLGARRRWAPTAGMGDAFIPVRNRVVGYGLWAERELIALSAFPTKRRP